MTLLTGIVLISPDSELASACVRESKSFAEASGAAHTRVSIVPGSESEYVAGARAANTLSAAIDTAATTAPTFMGIFVNFMQLLLIGWRHFAYKITISACSAQAKMEPKGSKKYLNNDSPTEAKQPLSLADA